MTTRTTGAAAVAATAALLIAGLSLAPAAALAAVGVSHEAALADGGTRSTVTVHAGAGAANHRMSVLILDEHADLDRPAAADIVYLNEVPLDASGAATFTFAIPSADLDAYAIAVNTDSSSTSRYVASLDPRGSLPSTPTQPGGGNPSPGGGANPGSGPRGSGGGGDSGSADPSEGVTPEATPPPTSSPSSGPSGDPEETDGDGTPEAMDPDAGGTAASPLPWVLAAAAVVALGGLVVLVIVVRRRRST